MTTIEVIVPALPENRKIHAIMAQSLESLASLFHDCEDDINLALTESEEGKITISHSICIDMGKDKQTDKLSVSIKRGDEITCNMTHPDQKEMFNRDGSVREVTPKSEQTAPAVLGLPAPAAEPLCIEAEILPNTEETATPKESNEDVWMLNGPTLINDMYADNDVSRDELPWCAIDANGDLAAFALEPKLKKNVWTSRKPVKASEFASIGNLGGEVCPELWFWDGTTWERKFPESTEASTNTEGGEVA